jgi:hypothetical protein
MRRKEAPDLFFDFKLSPFTRTLSYRDFLTSLSLALLLLAIDQFIEYYSSEEFFRNKTEFLKYTFFFLVLPINHMFYKVEHKRSNNYMGRVVHDFIFLVSFLSITKLYDIITGLSVPFALDPVIAIFMIVPVTAFIMCFELVIAIVNRLLSLVQWRIM